MSRSTEAQETRKAHCEPLRSVHTNNFPEILQKLGISLIISTYQAGKLVVLRADGEHLNTHFRVFQKPMGIAADRHKIALGCSSKIWELRNAPTIARKIEPAGKHDACYLPRQSHITGDIDIHEMEWGGENNSDLWFVNTRFSCLCTLDREYSFVPRWRPKFVTALTPEDRCHLNGLAMVNHQPKYVTALGETDSRAGWRKNKAKGGVLIDVPSHEVICRGLSMPHSPRWYDDRLWVLESGQGSIAVCDRNTGTWETFATLPGFTRGLDFYGSLAFIGLSQVRETAVFSGIPLTERLNERICGIWIVDLKTAKTIAFLKFEDAVQEIFAVRVLPDIRFPEIIDWDEKLVAASYVLPNEALADVPKEQSKSSVVIYRTK
ncbi:TIGR03032 family protein [Myxosarcina sp. GI1]|uniref:TIGR03032 family protein n=1 Tax=Myxosarcina sp. GI1 TaxID=1541065 RepID=UPI00068E3E11|nr:TIGR03032 family protein [Myxosarcina sp. GI1]